LIVNGLEVVNVDQEYRCYGCVATAQICHLRKTLFHLSSVEGTG
jgi:hypothetical protein